MQAPTPDTAAKSTVAEAATNSSLATITRLYLVPAVVVIVALVHAIQWRTMDRSSWGAGCGFGMFCTVDYHGSRWLRAFRVDATGKRTELELTDDLATDGFRVKVLPTNRNLDLLASEIRRRNWYASGGKLVNTTYRPDGVTKTPVGKTPVSLDALEVEIWGIRFQPAQRRVVGHLLNRVMSRNETEFVSNPTPATGGAF